MEKALATRDWLTVGSWLLATLTPLVGSVALILLRRWLKSYDDLGGEVKKLWESMSDRVKREQHDVANAEMVAQMERMRIEAQAREGRILEAIEKGRAESRSDISNLRGELAGVHARIDRIRDQTPDRRPRG